jgi:hypothetical protein
LSEDNKTKTKIYQLKTLPNQWHFASSFNLKRHFNSKKHLDREQVYFRRKEIDAINDALLDEMDELEMRCDYDDDGHIQV